MQTTLLLATSKFADIPTVLGSIRRRSNFKRGMNPGRMMEIVAFFWTFSQCLSIDASEYTPYFVRILTDLAIKETQYLLYERLSCCFKTNFVFII